jgi:hypothetical protein
MLMNKRFMKFFEEMKQELTQRDSSGRTIADGISETEWGDIVAPQLHDYEISSVEEVVEEEDSEQSHGGRLGYDVF